MSEQLSTISITTGSDNVFADLQLDDADELLARTDLGIAIRRIVKSRHYNHEEIGQLFELTVAETNNFMDGQFHLFGEAELLGFLRVLEQKVTVMIAPRRVGERDFEVLVAG